MYIWKRSTGRRVFGALGPGVRRSSLHPRNGPKDGRYKSFIFSGDPRSRGPFPSTPKGRGRRAPPRDRSNTHLRTRKVVVSDPRDDRGSVSLHGVPVVTPGEGTWVHLSGRTRREPPKRRQESGTSAKHDTRGVETPSPGVRGTPSDTGSGPVPSKTSVSILYRSKQKNGGFHLEEISPSKDPPAPFPSQFSSPDPVGRSDLRSFRVPPDRLRSLRTPDRPSSVRISTTHPSSVLGLRLCVSGHPRP